MGMATFTEDTAQIQREFHGLSIFFQRMQQGVMSEHPEFNQLSIGMSGDYAIALKEGSTLVRVGSAIFGDRH